MFPQWCSWGFSCSRTWRCVTGQDMLGLPSLILTDTSISSYKMLQTTQHHIPVNPWKRQNFKMNLISKLTPNTLTVRFSRLTLLGSVSSRYSVQPSWAGRSEEVTLTLTSRNTSLHSPVVWRCCQSHSQYPWRCVCWADQQMRCASNAETRQFAVWYLLFLTEKPFLKILWEVNWADWSSADLMALFQEHKLYGKNVTDEIERINDVPLKEF